MNFMKGTTVPKEDLLNGIIANDKIDGSLTNQIIITQIDYAAGKVVNGKKQDAYSQTWKNACRQMLGWIPGLCS